MQIITDATPIESALIRGSFAYWQSKCQNGSIPGRSDINPSEILPILPNIIMVDFERNPFRVKYRLVGTRVVEMTGYEFTGRYLDEIAGRIVEGDFLECYQVASERKLPMMTRVTWRFESGASGVYDFCVLPLDDDGRRATRALAVECYDNLERHADDWPP